MCVSPIKYKKINLSPIGILAEKYWHEILNHADNLELGAFVVMPNHIHGILILTEDVETGHTLSLQIPRNRFQNQGKNTVSSIIGGFKSAVTKNARSQGYEFDWQSRFHDRIIRNDAEYQRINDYIENNVDSWDDDCYR